MAILSEPAIRRKVRPADETRRSNDLSPEESANVRKALRFLRTRLGASNLSAMLKVRRALIDKVCGMRGRPSAGLAIRAALAAGASVEDVLRGVWPPEGACPHCGRT